jgi:hypothetical protein
MNSPRDELNDLVEDIRADTAAKRLLVRVSTILWAVSEIERLRKIEGIASDVIIVRGPEGECIGVTGDHRDAVRLYSALGLAPYAVEGAMIHCCLLGMTGLRPLSGDRRRRSRPFARPSKIWDVVIALTILKMV